MSSDFVCRCRTICPSSTVKTGVEINFTLLLAHAHVKFQICMDTHQYIPAQMKTDSPIRIFFDFPISLGDLRSLEIVSPFFKQISIFCP